MLKKISYMFLILVLGFFCFGMTKKDYDEDAARLRTFETQSRKYDLDAECKNVGFGCQPIARIGGE